MEFKDKVYKKSNLEYNDSISTYENWGAQQNPNSFKEFHYFLKDIKPKQILEIGTSLGGFTNFLNYTCKLLDIDCKIISYDINYNNFYDEMRNNGIDVRVENVFSYNYLSVKNEVIDFIKKDGTTLILCDGGDKISEFKLLSNYMKIGDFIMAHDYAENEIVFKENIYKKVWNWFEISENDIIESCNKNNLISYNKEVFENIAWVCKKKYENNS